VFVQTSNSDLFEMISREADTFGAALIYQTVKGTSSLKVLSKDDAIPPGCAVSTISDETNVFLLVKGKGKMRSRPIRLKLNMGLVDFDAEIKRLESKRSKAEDSLNDLKIKVSSPDYESKVKADVKEINVAKVYHT
jgi:valyl-tRNA synthetase